jgi:hypothetical protein
MRRIARTFRRLAFCDRGSAAVEFAFIGMLLIAGSLLAIDFGRAYYLYNKISNAVERTARKSLFLQTTNDQLIAEISKDFPTGPEIPADEVPKVTVTDDTDFRTVKVSMLFRPVVPAFVKDYFTMSITRRLPKAS